MYKNTRHIDAAAVAAAQNRDILAPILARVANMGNVVEEYPSFQRNVTKVLHLQRRKNYVP